MKDGDVVPRVLAAAIVGCFFLPWADLMFFKISGFDMVRLASGIADYGKMSMPPEAFFAIGVPGFAGVSFVANNKVIYLLAGAFPIAMFLYTFTRVGDSRLLNMMGAGAWGTIAAGLALFVVALTRIGTNAEPDPSPGAM